MNRLRRLAPALTAVVVAALGMTALPAPTALAATPSIVGGVPADQPYPFEGTLLYDRGTGNGPQFHCGLSLVAKVDGISWFASNAHCGTVELQPTLLPVSALRVTLGSNYRSQQTTYPVSRTADVPFWSWTTPHPGPRGEQGDILLVGVPVLVPARPLMIAPSKLGDLLRVIGWGAESDTTQSTLPDGLQQLDVHQIAASNCAAADPGIATGELCTDNPNGAGMCFGDSGGSGLRRIAGRWYLVGSISRGVLDDEGLCGGDDPGILTSWWYYLPWMASVIFGSNWQTRVAHAASHAAPPLPQAISSNDPQRAQIAYALVG